MRLEMRLLFQVCPVPRSHLTRMSLPIIKHTGKRIKMSCKMICTWDVYIYTRCFGYLQDFLRFEYLQDFWFDSNFPRQ